MCYSMSNLSRLSDALFLFRSSTVVCLHLISEDKMLQLFLVPKEEFFNSFPLFCLINLIISRCSNHHNNFIPITSLSQSHLYPRLFFLIPPPPCFPLVGGNWKILFIPASELRPLEMRLKGGGGKGSATSGPSRGAMKGLIRVLRNLFFFSKLWPIEKHCVKQCCIGGAEICLAPLAPAFTFYVILSFLKSILTKIVGNF